MKRVLFIIMIFLPLLAYGADYQTTDKGEIGDAWYVRSNGDIVPKTDSTSDIGASDSAVAEIYTDSIIVNGTTLSAINKSVNLPIGSFTTSGILLLGNSTPKLATNNISASIVWVDDDTDPAEITFRVPDDYISGGAFRLIMDLSAMASDAQVDYDVYVNTAGTAWDSSATDQTPVDVKTNNAGVGSPEQVTLSVTTDFASLSAGDIVTFRVWRRDDGIPAATSDMELYSAEFYYN